jgi:hypothetical protein
MHNPKRVEKVVGFLNSKSGIIFLSIVWALGLAAMCRSVCRGRGCYQVKPYQMSNILNNNFRHTNGKCYKYYPYNSDCSN